MFARGFKVRERTLRAVLSFSELGMKGAPEIEERKDPLGVLGKQVGNGAYGLMEDQHLGVAAEVLKLIRTNENTAPTLGTLAMYQNLVRSYLKKDEFVAAALVFERMIEDWAGWLPSTATPAATTDPSSAFDVSPESLHLSNTSPITPMQFAEQTHGLFHTFCAKLKAMLLESRLRSSVNSEETVATAERLQSNLVQAICFISSLLDRRILPYFNIYKLLGMISGCSRIPSYYVTVKSGDMTVNSVATNSHFYLRDMVSTFINDVSSPNFSSIPEISELFRSRKVLLPNFDLLSYRALLLLAFRSFRNAHLAKMVILPMLKDDEMRRKCLDKETCRSLTRSPIVFSQMGLNSVVNNYVWNQAGVELTRPVTTIQSSQKGSLGLRHQNGEETQVGSR